MDITGNSEEFNLCVTLMTKLLKLQDKEIFNACEETLDSLLGSDCRTEIMTVAVFQLAETDPENFHWILHNLPELKACCELTQDLMMFAVNKLIKKGFVLGTDFSISHNNAILINEKAQAELMRELIPSDRTLLKQILLVRPEERQV